VVPLVPPLAQRRAGLEAALVKRYYRAGDGGTFWIMVVGASLFVAVVLFLLAVFLLALLLALFSA
jgi:hypothetical protein